LLFYLAKENKEEKNIYVSFCFNNPLALDIMISRYHEETQSILIEALKKNIGAATS
jgi:hypothetical protein